MKPFGFGDEQLEEEYKLKVQQIQASPTEIHETPLQASIKAQRIRSSISPPPKWSDREGMMELVHHEYQGQEDRSASKQGQESNRRISDGRAEKNRIVSMQQDVVHQEGGEAREEGSKFSEKQNIIITRVGHAQAHEEQLTNSKPLSRTIEGITHPALIPHYYKSINRQYLMAKQIIIFSCLILLLTALFTSPDEWLEKGFDIRDGVLKNFPNYNLQVETKCTEVNLNKAGTSYNYNGTVLSGYLKVGKGNSALGFIFYGKENVERAKLNTIPTVLWLNGGPGSSSQLGNMMELGPFWVVKSSSKPYDVARNKYAWTNNYNVIFVDQPVGTGLSYADPSFPNVYVTNMSQMADDFYAALKELYNNPNGCFQRVNIRGEHPLFVFGQSYAGKYAPAIGLKIANEAKNNKGFLTGLKGVAIGDGFTHPFSTLSMMGEYAYNFGLIDYQQRAKIEQYILNATYQESNKRWKDLHESFYKVLNTIVNGTGGVNVYDITKYEKYPTSLLDEYFNSPNVIALFGLDPSVKYNSQGGNVGEALYEDFMKNEVRLVEELLIYHDVQFLVYTGQNDLIVETPGTLRWVERVHYADSSKFKDTLLTPWKINKKVVGFYKRVGNLWLRNINDAGHLVPMDQGEVALALVSDFVTGTLSGEKEENVIDQEIVVQ